jgi:hypothetical protein
MTRVYKDKKSRKESDMIYYRSLSKQNVTLIKRKNKLIKKTQHKTAGKRRKTSTANKHNK